MLRLKTLSSKELIKILEKFGFSKIGQKGSHIRMRRILNDGIRQSLTLPDHKEISRGTMKAIYTQATRFVSEEDLRKSFYTK